MGAILAIIAKEFKHIRRDRRMIPLILISPVFQLVLLGYAATLDVHEVPLAICDLDRSEVSRDLIGRLQGTGIFNIMNTTDCDEIDFLIRRGHADLGLIVPRNFGRGLLQNTPGKDCSLLVVVDGTKALTATIGLSYARETITHFLIEQGLSERAFLSLRQGGPDIPWASQGEPQDLSGPALRLPTISIEPRVFYNDELRSADYMVPAVLAMVLMLMTVVLSSMNLVREKESGTIEQVIVSPIRPFSLLLGKLVPFVMIGLIDVCIVLTVAIFWFKVPFRGSLAFLFCVTLLFLLSTLGLGLLVSVWSSTQQQAMMTSVFFIMVPSVLLSGFIFPVENMPRLFQVVSLAIPMRHYLEVVRDCFLKGSGPVGLFRQVLALGLLGPAILGLAVTLFRKRID